MRATQTARLKGPTGRLRSGNAAMPAKAQGRMRPLRGVNAAVKGNIAGFKGLPVSLRSRGQAGAAYRFKTNQLGKSTAASIGFNAAIARGQRGGVAQSAPRNVFRAGKSAQLNLMGGVDRVRSGSMRPVGTRRSDGRVSRWDRRRR